MTAPRVFVRNLLAICDEASIWALLAGMCLDGLVHKVHCVRKMQVKADTPMVVYLSCRTLGDCYLVIQSLNGRTVSGMSKYPLLAEVAEPPGTTGKAAALAPTGVKLGGVPWRSGGPRPAPPPPPPPPPPTLAAPEELMVSKAKSSSLVAPKSLALNKANSF